MNSALQFPNLSHYLLLRCASETSTANITFQFLRKEIYPILKLLNETYLMQCFRPNKLYYISDSLDIRLYIRDLSNYILYVKHKKSCFRSSTHLLLCISLFKIQFFYILNNVLFSSECYTFL